ncbi:carotenoid biosynthesis protein [Bacteroidota bacterium]
MSPSLPSEKKILSFLRAWFLIGILGFAFPFTHAIFRHIIPFTILLMAMIILAYHRPINKPFMLITFMVAILGFGIEVAGIKTGLLFGEYKYGSILGPKIAEVPIVMGLNWVVMVYGGVAIASRTRWGIIPGSLISGLILTVSDLIIEKFAILTGMWTWVEGVPSFRNSAGWFIISCFLSLLYYQIVKPEIRKVAIYVYIYQMILFISTIVILTLFWQ